MLLIVIDRHDDINATHPSLLFIHLDSQIGADYSTKGAGVAAPLIGQDGQAVALGVGPPRPRYNTVGAGHDTQVTALTQLLIDDNGGHS